MHLKKMEVILGDASICLFGGFIFYYYFLFVLFCFVLCCCFFAVVHYVATNIQLSVFIHMFPSLAPNAPPDNVATSPHSFLHCHLGDVGPSTRDIKEWNHHTV